MEKNMPLEEELEIVLKESIAKRGLAQTISILRMLEEPPSIEQVRYLWRKDLPETTKKRVILKIVRNMPRETVFLLKKLISNPDFDKFIEEHT